MSKKKILVYSSLAALFLLGWIFSPSDKENKDVSERAKVALRNVGNDLLLMNKDTSSLVLPIKEVEDFKYELSFQNNISFEPSQLVSLIKDSFRKASLTDNYRVEVIQCSDNEVAYSYEMKENDSKSIIPCKGRDLPRDCYIIQVKLTKRSNVFLFKNIFLPVLFLTMILLGIAYMSSKSKKKDQTKQDIDVTKIGSFQFYPTENKLVKQATEISLSKKECELLMIFIEHQNKIVTREELTKKVWEDKGVFVGRSLDTYISKLRKKLKDDASIKLSNIHGIGYKLEVKMST